MRLSLKPTLGLLVGALLVSGGIRAYAVSSPADNTLMGNPSGATTDVANENNYLMQKPAYTLSYNRSKGVPNWVSWRLGDGDVGGSGRNDAFGPDPALPSGWYRVTDDDYSGSGYDRGHNCPSGDRTSTVDINKTTFLMTNMVPQTADNNQGPWAKLEEYCRTLRSRGNTLYIISVPNQFNRVTIANKRVFVPRYMSKVILVMPGTKDVTPDKVTSSTRVICVDMPNIAGIRDNGWGTYRVSVDQLESYTGYDFLSQVPQSIQNEIEARVDNGATS